MKFYIGDKVRMLNWCMVLQDDSRLDYPAVYSGTSQIFTISAMKKFSEGRIGFAFEGHTTPIFYSKQGLELVKRGRHGQLKYRVGDKVRTKTNLVGGKRYGCLTYWHDMNIEGTIDIVDRHDKTYKVRGSRYWYSEEMLEGVRRTK